MIGQYRLGRLKSLAPGMLLAFLLCLNVSAAFGQVRDAFKLRGPGGLQGDPNTCIFSLHGDFTMIANINQWAANGQDNSSRVNNSTNMVKVDLDGDASTSNSSMAELKLNSSCSKIVYAGLYWTAKTASSGIMDVAKRTVKIKGPGATAYNTLTSPMYSRLPGDSYQYVCFTDVTQYVKQQGVGQYWVADIALTEGSDDNTGYYAGWGMVVIYEDADLPMRNIAMFDGYAYVASGTLKYSIPVSGFKSAQTGPVKVKLGFMAGEGDAGYSGDWCQMKKASATGDVNNDNDWIHLENPSTSFSSQNFWRSRVTNDAGAARNPNRTNNLGFDAFVLTADNTNNQFIGNNQTSTAIRYGTSQDQYIIFNMTMAVDAYEPDPVVMNQINTTGTSYADQKTVAPGDTMTYKVNITNDGNEAVLNTKIEIPVPFNATYVTNSISATYDASLTGATTTFDPANQKIVINLGTLPVAPTTNPNKIFATITYKLKATSDCYYLKNTNTCLRNIAIQGTVTGTGAITGVAVNKKTISGYMGGTCTQNPITSATTSTIVVPASYTACNNYTITTPNLRICPGTATSIAATTIRNLLTLPSSITYVFNSASDGSGTVYNDNNPFPVSNGTYYAVPVNTIDTSCKGSIPFTVTILSVTTPPTVPNTSLTYCPSALPVTLSATATSTDYTVFWYTQASGGNSTANVTIPANTAPGTYTYYVAQGYDASCQSSRTTVTVKVNVAPVAPSLTGPASLCGGLEDNYSIVSPNAGYAYEWALDNAPAGIAFKNNIFKGTTVTLTETALASGTFTIKVRAQDTLTKCYSDYRTLSVTVNPKPATPSTFSGPTQVCEGSVGNIYTLTNPAGTNYEWAYSGTGYTWVNGSNTTQTVELQFATGATSGNLTVRAKTITGCYSDPVTQAITVNPRPTEPSNVTADNICMGQQAIVKINNSNAALKYQVYSGSTAIGNLTTGNSSTLSINIGTYPAAGTFSYTVKSFNDKCYSTGQTPVSFTVLSIPDIPVVSAGTTTCYNTQPVIRVLNAVVGASYRVYADAGLATLLTTVTATATLFDITITDNPTANKNYYVTSSNGICASQAATVPVIVRDQIMAPSLSSANICAGQKPTIIVSNPVMTGGLFDTLNYQYYVYQNSNGTNEIALTGTPEQISSTQVVLHPNTTIMGNTTLYARLTVYGCNGPLSPVNITIADRPAPSVITPITQCLETRALITIHNTVKGYRYRVYDAPTGGTLLRDIISLQSGDLIISISQTVVWTAGTNFYVQEAVRDENDLTDICLSPFSTVTMQNGTPVAPSFTFNPAYTCSTTTATLTINNTLSNHTYNIYDTETGLTPIASITPGAYVSQYPFTVNLPVGFSGSATYYMDLVENGSTCNSLRTPVTITLATPNTPALENAALTVCRGSIPVINVSNAQKDVIYTITNTNGDTVAGPVTAPANGNLAIPISNLTLSNQQTTTYHITAQAPAFQNSCQSAQTSFTLTDGEPTMPLMSNLTVCHGAPINVTVPSPVAGYTYLVYDAANNLLGFTDVLGNLTLPDPNIANPAGFTNLNYYVKVQSQSTTCMSESAAPFSVRVNHTAEAGTDFIISSPVVCEHSDVVFQVTLLSPALISSGATIKWYNNSDLTELIDTQVIPAGTSTTTKILSGLPDDIYVYSVTAESAAAGFCPNKPEDAVIATAVVKPHTLGADISALDAVICNGDPVTLTMQLDNPAITNPIYNWYSDPNHTVLVAANTPTFTPNPNLTANADYYVTIHNNNYCEGIPGEDEWIHVEVNPVVLPPSASVSGNTAICRGNDLVLQVTPIGTIPGYELWENGSPVPAINYAVNLTANTITVFAPSVGNHSYTIVSEFYSNGIICESDETSVTATVSAIVNNVVPTPSISLVSADICRGDTTTFNVTYTGTQPSGYKLMNGTGLLDPLFYSVSSDMQTIKLIQPTVGYHSYTLISQVMENGIICESQPSAPAESNVYARPSATITNTTASTLCSGSNTSLNLQFIGTPPFTYSVQAVDINNQVTYPAQNITTNATSVTLTPTVSSKTTYIVSALSDAHCNALPGDLPTAITVDVFRELQPGSLLSNVEICNYTDLGDLNVTFAFDGDTAHYQYSWKEDTGSGLEDISANTASYDPGVLNAGSYTYQRTINDGCQTKTTQTTVTVHPDLNGGSLVADTGICNGTSPGNLSLTLPTGGNDNQYAYMWKRFDSITPNGTIVSLSADYNPGTLTTGTYRFERVVNDACQIDTNEVTITVFSDLTPGLLTANVSLCLNLIVNPPVDLNISLPIGGNSLNYQYSWQRWNPLLGVWADLNVSTATYRPTLSDLITLGLGLGDNILRRTVADGCQTVSATATISLFNDLHPGELVVDTVICNGSSPGNLNRKNASLCSAATGISYQWYRETMPGTWVSIPTATNADYNPANLSTGTYHYKRVASHYVLLVLSFSDSVSTTVTVLPDLTAGTLVPDTSICNGSSPGSLSRALPTGGNSTHYTYKWQQFNGTSFADIVPAVTSSNYNPDFLSSGVYQYRRIVNDGCQFDTATTSITVFTELTAGSLKDTAICNGTTSGELNLTLPTGGNTTNYVYSWQTWVIDTLIDISPAVTTPGHVPANFTQPGSYLFQRTVSDGCQTQTAQATVTVRANPDAYVTTDPEVCEGQTFPLIFSFTGTSPWTVTFIYGSSNTQVIETFSAPPYQYIIMPQETTTYSIKKVVDGNGCTTDY